MSLQIEFVQEENADGNTFAQVFGAISYGLALTVSLPLRFGIIHFEKYGGDPMKRSFGNHMISFIFEVSCVSLFLPGAITVW